MATEPLRRRHYFEDPRDSTLHPLVDNNNVQIYDTSVRDLPPTYVEEAINTSHYSEPLARAHASGAHGWGIASGLSITATLNQAKVTIKSGIAVDLVGRHICLAEGGSAEIGPNADNPTVSPQLASVVAAGVDLPTTGLNGAFYVTIAWCETLDQTQWTQSLHTIPEMRNTPWLRLEPVGNITDITDDGSRIVLGRVQINAGNVTGLTEERRREVSLPAGTLRLLRGATTNGVADNIVTGEIRARATAGLEFRVSEPTAQVDFYRDDGTNVAKTIQKISLGADQVVARRGDGKETVSIDSTQANITLGTNGIEGDLLVRDAQNRLVITLDGQDAALVVGAAGNEGDILVKNNAGQNSIRMDGNTGSVFSNNVAVSSKISVGENAQSGTILVRDNAGQDSIRLDGNTGTIHARDLDVSKLHLANSVKVVNWESLTGFTVSAGFQTFYELDTQLSAAEWNVASTCEVGLRFNANKFNAYIWETHNASAINAAGNWVIKWQVWYGPGVSSVSDAMVLTSSVMWVAIRR